jgi:lipid II:glycine glycyltransferase (peptidoglycan interpeptide bridge formation enzyme)
VRMNGPSKELYRKLCENEKTIPLFLNDWWLDAACGENWDVALVLHGSEVAGALPYYYTTRMGFRIIKMPMLTGFLGPWINYPEGQKQVTRLSYEMEIMDALLKALPPFDMFRQRFHYSIKNWLPFYWMKFEQTTRYTYVLTVENLDEVFNEFKSSVRGKIRKASNLVTVEFDRPLEDFYRLFSMTFERQKIKTPATLSYLARLDEALVKRRLRKIFYAVDEKGGIHSALYLIWDSQSAYVHMVGEDPELRNSGAGILLLWEAIQFTRNTLSISKFDFLGSMIESVETVRRSFGAQQVPYFQIRKANSIFMKIAFFFAGS